MNFLNFNNAIINIKEVDKITVQNNKIYVMVNGNQYEYEVTEENAKKAAIELHKELTTSGNITIDIDVTDTFFS